jgi:hypothetical protein
MRHWISTLSLASLTLVTGCDALPQVGSNAQVLDLNGPGCEFNHVGFGTLENEKGLSDVIYTFDEHGQPGERIVGSLSGKLNGDDVTGTFDVEHIAVERYADVGLAESEGVVTIRRGSEVLTELRGPQVFAVVFFYDGTGDACGEHVETNIRAVEEGELGSLGLRAPGVPFADLRAETPIDAVPENEWPAYEAAQGE